MFSLTVSLHCAARAFQLHSAFVILPLPRSASTVPEACLQLLQCLLLEPSGASTTGSFVLQRFYTTVLLASAELWRLITALRRCSAAAVCALLIC